MLAAVRSGYLNWNTHNTGALPGACPESPCPGAWGRLLGRVDPRAGRGACLASKLAAAAGQ